jgi:Tol biopolymer transport system component
VGQTGTPWPSLWLADADGSNVTRLTNGPGRQQDSARWSPDGRSVVFDAQDESGRQDIWTIEADGSGLRQVTRTPVDEGVPSYSHDGRFIYYTSPRTGRPEIWRMPTGGGPEEQLTRDGGIFPRESQDGATLYYQRSLGPGPLLARGTAGGAERTILPCVPPYGFEVAPRGVFHVTCPSEPTRALRYWDAASGKSQQVAVLDADFVVGLSAAPDGSVLFGRHIIATDLMMIDNFR